MEATTWMLRRPSAPFLVWPSGAAFLSILPRGPLPPRGRPRSSPWASPLSAPRRSPAHHVPRHLRALLLPAPMPFWWMMLEVRAASACLPHSPPPRRVLPLTSGSRKILPRSPWARHAALLPFSPRWALAAPAALLISAHEPRWPLSLPLERMFLRRGPRTRAPADMFDAQRRPFFSLPFLSPSFLGRRRGLRALRPHAWRRRRRRSLRPRRSVPAAFGPWCCRMEGCFDHVFLFGVAFFGFGYVSLGCAWGRPCRCCASAPFFAAYAFDVGGRGFVFVCVSFGLVGGRLPVWHRVAFRCAVAFAFVVPGTRSREGVGAPRLAV